LLFACRSRHARRVRRKRAILAESAGDDSWGIQILSWRDLA